MELIRRQTTAGLQYEKFEDDLDDFVQCANYWQTHLAGPPTEAETMIHAETVETNEIRVSLFKKEGHKNDWKSLETSRAGITGLARPTNRPASNRSKSAGMVKWSKHHQKIRHRAGRTLRDLKDALTSKFGRQKGTALFDRFFASHAELGLSVTAKEIKTIERVNRI